MRTSGQPAADRTGVVPDDLPPPFLEYLRRLEDSYCLVADPIRQSGFSGGPERWRAEREPILEAIDQDGDILDVGCANGYLLQCLVLWAREKDLGLVPHGLDLGPRLIQLARALLPEYSSNLHLGNAWNWLPPRRYPYVYSLWDCVPESHFEEYCRRLLTRMVEPGGKLIVGVYGSRSRGIIPFDLGERLGSLGLSVAGTTAGGDPLVSRFAWVNAQGERS